MAKRELLVNLKKGETENGFSKHGLHERPPERDSESVNERSRKINKQDPIYTLFTLSGNSEKRNLVG